MITNMARRRPAIILICAASALALTARSQPSAPSDTPFVNPASAVWPGGGSVNHAVRQLWLQQTAAERLRLFPDSPHTVGWLSNADRMDDALAALARVVERHPLRLAEALAGFKTHDVQMDQTRGYKARARQVIQAARQKLAGLDREGAATSAFALLALEQASAETYVEYDARVEAFLGTYPDTEAARLAEVDLTRRGRPSPARLAALDAIAARHPGTVVAAKARYTKAFQLARNWSNFVLAGADPDPTESFLELIAIVKDLESGRYPPCTWVDQAPALVTGYSMFRPAISPANAARMFEGFRQFVGSHLSLLDDAPAGTSLAHVVGSLMPAVASFLPDGPTAMERLFAEFEREWPDVAAARLLKASWLELRRENVPWPVAVAPPSPTREAEVRALLASAAAAGDGVHARQALARLAEREFLDYASLSDAHRHYLEYVARFGATGEAWVPALRAAQVEQAQGRAADAARRFAHTAATFAAEPVARVLGLAYAGRASEEAGAFDAARGYYREAVEAWPKEVGDSLSLDLPRPPAEQRMGIEPLAVNRALVQRADLDRRAREIARSLAVEGGIELEKGRWLWHQGRAQEAVPVLDGVARRHRGNAAGAEARTILKRARLDAALARVDARTPSPDEAAALKELDALAGASFDATSGIAAIVGATIRMLQGSDADATAAMTRALGRWVREGTTVRTAPRPGTLEYDVLAVRDAVFMPLGGDGVLGRNWNASEWPATLPPYVVSVAALRVKVAGSDTSVDVNVARQPPGLSNVVFIPPDDVPYLTRAVSRLGGTQRREPAAIMEIPNQPVGGARAIVQWWNQFFPARPGHWSGFEILTDPAFSSVEFTDVARTRALVPFAVGYSGATAVLEKIDGAWTIKELVNRWIT